MLERLVLLHAETFHHLRHAIRSAEIAHEVVFEADVEAAEARVTLARATPAELAIDTPSFVTLGTNDVQATDVRNAWAELNVGAAAGHVRGDRYAARLTGTRDDLGFLHVILRVQHGVRNLLALEHAREDFRRLN